MNPREEEIARLKRLQMAVESAIRLLEAHGMGPREPCVGWPAELMVIGPFIILERRALGVTYYPIA